MRPRQWAVRALALTLAAGLCWMLVGLSVAATQMPGDTFQATPKAIASAVVASLSDEGAVDPGLSCGCVHVTFMAVPLVLLRTGMVLVRPQRRHHRWVAPALSVSGCRGPPLAIR